MKKKIVIGCLLAVFLLLMIPNASAVEYNEVKESQEQIIENKLNKLSDRLENCNFEKFKGKLNELLVKAESLKSNSPLDDPGDGEDHNGPDDFRDLFYLLFAIILSPYYIIEYAFEIVLSAVLGLFMEFFLVIAILIVLAPLFWIFSGTAPDEPPDFSFIEKISQFINSLWILLEPFLYLLFTINYILWIPYYEAYDWEDIDGDGR